MVTENIFQLFSFDPNSARPDGHFGVLHDHISASINAWIPQNSQNRQKCDVSCMVTMVKRSKLAVSSVVTMVTVYLFISFFL